MSNATFWSDFYHLGKISGAKFPELLAAQAALESGWGKHRSGKNNYFGIKGSPGTVVSTQEWDGSKMITINAEFKDFATPLECVEYLVDRWYKDYKGYKGINRASDRDEAARLLKAEGYATDPEYPGKLIKLMNDNDKPAAKPVPAAPAQASFIMNAVRFFNNEPHQVAAFEGLWGELDPATREWFIAAYRNELSDRDENALDVPYFYQLDSKTSHKTRMCFTSSMAMALDYVDPEKLGGDDDWYLSIVLYFGDTVDSQAQVKAARSLGYDTTFHMDGTQKRLEELIDSGMPVPIGVLHKGSLESPSGGGHWMTIVGHDDTHFIAHDPLGRMDIANGGYAAVTPGEGEFVKYSKDQLMKRWLIASDSDGWYVKVD